MAPRSAVSFWLLPAIFCASATLIEKHEIRRKREAGLDGERRGQGAAALDAAGAALGAIGMLAFAVVFWLLVEERHRCVRRRLAGLACRLGGGLVRAAQDANCVENAWSPKTCRTSSVENRRRLLVRRPARRRNGYSWEHLPS